MTAPIDPNSDTAHDIYDVEAVNRRQHQQPLYTGRKRIHPKRAKGSFRSFKWLMMALTLGVYYITPWIRWDRGPHAPDQAVLVDLANRRFYFFFIEIWPQEFFFVAGMLVMAGIGLFLVTSTVGRAWCGYACPQTIWVDLFLAVERFFEGDRNARIKLDKQPMNAAKLFKRGAKHLVSIVIAIATGGAWVFYFEDAPTLFEQIIHFDAPTVAYGTIAVLAGFTYVLGGLAREQVCTYMCPWPRIQAAMLDENSLTVTYNNWRGEPRSRHHKKLMREGVPVGDCVDCNACVAVCPMGIDIRDGQQLECITCALCIDACNGVMDKLGLERGLISYTTLSEYNQNMALASHDSEKTEGAITIDPALVRNDKGKLFDYFNHVKISSFVRPRTLIYLGIYSVIGLSLLYQLFVRDRLDLNVLHQRNPTFVLLKDGSIRNGYDVKILNMLAEPRQFELSIAGIEGAKLKMSNEDKESGTSVVINVKPDQLSDHRIYVSAPKKALKSQSTPLAFKVKDLGPRGETATYESLFKAP